MTARKFGKIILSQLLCLCAAFTACTDNDEVASPNDSRAPLQVTVNANNPKVSRSIVHGEWLPDASTIGVSLFNAADGEDYDNQGYYNIKYTASGEEDAQTWAPTGVTPSISSNEAALVAYYPYSDAENLDITAMPVEIATQTDYMYSTPVTAITNASPKANITLYHALTAIRVKLVLGNFTGSADVTDVTVSSPALASEATLNAFDGALSNISGQGDNFTLAADYTLNNTGTDNDIMFVPDASVTSGSTTVSATIGGKKYTAGITFAEAYKQGYIYTYTLTLNNTGFEVTKVNVNPWNEGTSEDATLSYDYQENDYVVEISILEGDNLTYYHNLWGFTGIIDWGDGTVQKYDYTEDYTSHTYSTTGNYIVRFTGTTECLDSYCKTRYITRVIYAGDELNLMSINYAFYKQTRLTSVCEGLFDSATNNVMDASYAFYNCTSLKSIPADLCNDLQYVEYMAGMFAYSGIEKIPEGLFDECVSAKYWSEDCYSGVFCRCVSLTSIPEGLFRNCKNTTELGNAFYGCEALTEIPEGLFKGCSQIISFEGVFGGCYYLQTIPEGLFNECVSLEAVDECFMWCSSIQSIPKNLFKNNEKITSFYMTFSYCEKLETIPEGLFDNCPNVTSFVETFDGCSALTAIPEGLFDNCPNVTSFVETFDGCSALTAIPEGLFDACTKVTNFKYTFYGCTSLTGESPYSTIQVDGVDTKVHLYERSLYPNYFTAPTSYTDCFRSCTGLTDYTTMSTSYSTWI